MRIKRLDILRCAAILLVLFHHTAVLPSIAKIGFVGVDLFFVLSGFLISGLLYKEYLKRGEISFSRFFIRRGLKIYPAFYVMLLVTFIAQLLAGKLSTWGAYAREILFRARLQSAEKVGTAAAFIGLYSYSIYLWQGIIGVYATRGMEKYLHFELTGFPRFAWYFFGCVIFGIVMARLIEFPVLKLRDRFFPPVTTSVIPPPPVENPYEALTSSKSA